ncbi:hypothetical protein L1987_73285 [Smallanthus sonchifolius]|uniref:Uncharacterized protein n=1 Tax=Smallanthus sonchifolius TaxID=185202 RepID=A0ACB9A096_9ASTR|nr:hypothetical protein L1987_73285 [Smallanthus sonchifolius]
MVFPTIPIPSIPISYLYFVQFHHLLQGDLDLFSRIHSSALCIYCETLRSTPTPPFIRQTKLPLIIHKSDSPIQNSEIRSVLRTEVGRTINLGSGIVCHL